MNQEMLKAEQSLAFRKNGKTEYGAITYVQVANAVENQERQMEKDMEQERLPIG